MSGVILFNTAFVNNCCALAFKGTFGASMAGLSAALITNIGCRSLCRYGPSDSTRDKISVTAGCIVGGALATYYMFHLSHLAFSTVFLTEGANIYSKITGYMGIASGTMGTVTIAGTICRETWNPTQ